MMIRSRKFKEYAVLYKLINQGKKAIYISKVLLRVIDQRIKAMNSHQIMLEFHGNQFIQAHVQK